MKKHVKKLKPALSKSGAVDGIKRTGSVLAAKVNEARGPHDPLELLLRDAYARRICHPEVGHGETLAR